MKLLSVKDLVMIHFQIIDESGGSEGVRDEGRLESAISAQSQEVFGQELYPTLFDKAAALCRGIIGDHPFVDGNKRTGIMSAIIFLNYNGIDTLRIKDKELEDFAVQVAVDRLEVAVISAWLRSKC